VHKLFTGLHKDEKERAGRGGFLKRGMCFQGPSKSRKKNEGFLTSKHEQYKDDHIPRETWEGGKDPNQLRRKERSSRGESWGGEEENSSSSGRSEHGVGLNQAPGPVRKGVNKILIIVQHLVTKKKKGPGLGLGSGKGGCRLVKEQVRPYVRSQAFKKCKNAILCGTVGGRRGGPLFPRVVLRGGGKW